MATMIETLERIRRPVPRAMLKVKSKGGSKLVYVPWYRAVELQCIFRRKRSLIPEHADQQEGCGAGWS